MDTLFTFNDICSIIVTIKPVNQWNKDDLTRLKTISNLMHHHSA